MSDAVAVIDLIAPFELPLVRLDAGETLFFAGQAGGRMFVVQQGSLEVLRDGRVLERVGAGGIVGEMALAGAADRSAAVLALEASTLFAIDRGAFLEIVARQPRFALAVLDVLAARLRRANAG